MKQSKNINLIFINVVAASLLAGCSTPQDNKQCVDENGVVIDESNCNPDSVGYSPHYRWYYGGGLFNRGMRVNGGSYYPNNGRSYVTPSQRAISGGESVSGGSKVSSPISRGGFGTTGHSSGGE
jgi:hypothetical protein